MKSITHESCGQAGLRCCRPTVDTLQVELSGHWRLQHDVPAATTVAQQLDATPGVQRLSFETQALGDWDSGLVTFLIELLALGARRQNETGTRLPPEAAALYPLPVAEETTLTSVVFNHYRAKFFGIFGRIGLGDRNTNRRPHKPAPRP